MTREALPRSLCAVVGAEHADSTLLARMQAGDEAALGIVYDQHASLVYGLARRVLRDDQLARDITQDVFSYLWEWPHRVDLQRGAIRSYLAVVTHRRAVDEVRRSERRSRVESSVPVQTTTESPEVAVVDEAARRWRAGRLSAGLAQLPTGQRRAVELAYYEGLSYQEVARVLQIPEGTAKSRMRLAMTRLRAFLGDDVRTALT